MNDGWPAVGDMTFMHAAPFLWGEVPLRVSRSGYTGEDGFEISVPAEHAAALRRCALCRSPRSGRSALARAIRCGWRRACRFTATTCRPRPTRSGRPGLRDQQAPQGRGGRLPGAERVLGQLAGGAPRKRVGLLLEGRMAAREGAAVFAGDEQVGVVTSGGFSPSLERPIAMAYVAAAHAADGTALTIDVRGKRLAATVAPLPFVPHRYHRKGAAA